jgi:transposase-like protein
MKKSKFSESQIVHILQEAATGERTVADICRQHGVSQNT